MPYRGVVGRASRIFIATTLLGISGCQSKPSHQVAKKVVATTALPALNSETIASERPAPAIQPASYSNPPAAGSQALTPAIELPAPTEELQLELLIQGVLARNPSLQAWLLLGELRRSDILRLFRSTIQCLVHDRSRGIECRHWDPRLHARCLAKDSLAWQTGFAWSKRKRRHGVCSCRH